MYKMHNKQRRLYWKDKKLCDTSGYFKMDMNKYDENESDYYKSMDKYVKLRYNEITDKQIVEEENVWKLFWINWMKWY